MDKQPEISNSPSSSRDIRSELSSLSLRELFFKYIRFIPLFVVSVGIALIVAYVYLRYTDPLYSSSGAILIKDEKSMGSRGDKFDELFTGNAASNISTEMEILKSSPLMERVVRQYDLSWSYHVLGNIRTINVYRLCPFRLVAQNLPDTTTPFALSIQVLSNDAVKVEGIVQPVAYGQSFTTSRGTFQLLKNQGGFVGNVYRVEWNPPKTMATSLAALVKIAPRPGGNGILNLTIQLTSPELCADVLNGLMDNYGEYSIEQKKLSSDQIMKFAEDRLADIGRRLDSAQNLYLDYQIRYNIIDPESQLSAFSSKIVEADKILDEQNVQLGFVNMLDDYLADKKNEFYRVVVPSSMGINDPILGGLVGSYNQIQLQRQLLVDSRIPVDNPSIKELDGQLERVRLSIRENLRNIQVATNKSIATARSRGQQGQAKLNDMPLRIKELAEIKRQVASYQALYELFVEKKEETAISRASTVSSSSVLEQALVPEVPVSPNRRSIQLVALLIGLAIPVVFIFGGELLNDKILNRFDIERYTQTPILGEIGHSYAEEALVVSKSNRKMVAEQFRIIRTNLQYFLPKKEKVTIMVTSTLSGEGKSFISLNLAAVHALAGKKTIVLEFDIRKPKILSELGMEKGAGLTNYLVGKTDDISSLIQPIKGVDNLYVLGCGPVPPNPAEILLDGRMESLFQYIQSHYDVVVIDTAPVGMVSDGVALGKYADCTVYVARQSHSFKKQLVLIEDYYKQKRLPGLSILLNDVKLRSGYGYYGSGRYGYGGYGYGYYDEERKTRGRFDGLINWWRRNWS